MEAPHSGNPNKNERVSANGPIPPGITASASNAEIASFTEKLEVLTLGYTDRIFDAIMGLKQDDLRAQVLDEVVSGLCIKTLQLSDGHDEDHKALIQAFNTIFEARHWPMTLQPQQRTDIPPIRSRIRLPPSKRWHRRQQDKTTQNSARRHAQKVIAKFEDGISTATEMPDWVRRYLYVRVSADLFLITIEAYEKSDFEQTILCIDVLNRRLDDVGLDLALIPSREFFQQWRKKNDKVIVLRPMAN